MKVLLLTNDVNHMSVIEALRGMTKFQLFDTYPLSKLLGSTLGSHTKSCYSEIWNSGRERTD
jgi:hypothetical protein